jgi:hypothetical protein
MLDIKTRSMISPADAPSDEPSHIHIARPSRVRRQGASGSSREPTDEVRDLAPEITLQGGVMSVAELLAVPRSC